MSSVQSKLPEDNKSVAIDFDLLPGASISTGAVIFGCSRKREFPIPLKEQLLITLRNHLKDIQKRKEVIKANYDKLTKFEDELGIRRQRDVRDVYRNRTLIDTMRTTELIAKRVDGQDCIIVSVQPTREEKQLVSAPPVHVDLVSSVHPKKRKAPTESKPVAKYPLVPVAPMKPLSESVPIRSVVKRSPSNLYYCSYNELGESDQQLLSDFWKVIDLQFQPVPLEMANLVLGLADFPPISFASSVSENPSVSMSERLLSCLIPEDESQVSQSLERVDRYYSTNPERFRKRIRNDNTFDEECWVSRASLRHVEDLDQAIENDLESMDLWDEDEKYGQVTVIEDEEIDRLVWELSVTDE